MPIYIGNDVMRLMAKNQLPIHGRKVLVLGLTFKENCPDIRNSKEVGVVRELISFGTQVDIYDPHADSDEVKHEYKLEVLKIISKKYHAVVLAVGHKGFSAIKLNEVKKPNAVV